MSHKIIRSASDNFESPSKLVSLVIPHCPLTPEHDELLKRCVKSYRGAHETLIVVNNMGFGAACNLGVRLARCEYIAIVNNDTTCTGNWTLNDMCHPDAVTFPLVNGVVQEFSGAFLVFPRWVINKLGGQLYDERFKVGFWEDVDLWTRLKMLEIPIRQLNYLVSHPNPGSTMKYMPSDTDANNRLEYLSKHGTLPIKEWS